MTMPDVEEVLRRNIAAINARDLPAYLANQQPDLELVLPGGAVLRGREEAGQYIEAMWSAFPDGAIAFTSTVTAEDSAAVEITFSGTYTGPLATPDGTAPPTGKQVTLKSASILQIRDGLIASEHVYLDPTQMLTQLGLTGQPADHTQAQ